MYKNSIIFLKDWAILVQSLPDDKQLVFWGLFMNYPESKCNDIMVAPVWNFIKKQLDNMNEKYQEKIVERNKLNGKKGGRPKKETDNQQNKETQEKLKNPMGNLETQKTLNENENENENNNVTDNENIIKLKAFSFFKSLKDLGADDNLINDWLKVRKTKRLSNTETAFKGFEREFLKTQKDINFVLTKCIEKSWGGFESIWITKPDINKKPNIKENFEYLQNKYK